MRKAVCNNEHNAWTEDLSGKRNGLKNLIILHVCTLALALSLTACGGGDSGGSSGSNDSEESSNWDAMTWDQGTWG